MALAKTTKDHDEIRRWAEARGGKPAVVAATETDKATGILRLMFPNAPNRNDDALEEISWDEFFEKFDQSGLALVYQDVTADVERSNFNKLVYPENAKASSKASSGEKSAQSRTSSKAASRASSTKKPVASHAAAKKHPATKKTGTSGTR